MAVFENLKNFIRHGKQAYGNNSSTAPLPISEQKSHSQPILRSEYDGVPINSAPVPVPGAQIAPPTVDESKTKAYDSAVKQIVASENEQRAYMPTYSGLERYRLLEKMGDGAFSIVYKAFDTQSNQHVALKVIRKQDLNPSQRHLGEAVRNMEQSDQRSTILKEVAIMRQLSHHNVVALIDFQETPDYYFIVLELIPGGELFHQIVRLTYFSENLSRHVIIQVAEAVRYLHEVAGVVHRDIKPENLLYYPCDYIPSKVNIVRKGEDANKADEGEFRPGIGAGGIGTIKLADFGLSKIIWDSKTMTPCGTVGYTAPEIVKDERYSKSVDMWALGCVLYTILCGFPPFYDESIEVLTAKVAKGQYSFLSPWWDEISPLAKDLVSHLLEVNPEKRYNIDEFLAHPWIQEAYQPVQQQQVPVSVAASQTVPVEISTESAANIVSSTPQVMTPAAATLKEVFDVSNAVYRMENDNRRANQFGNNFGTQVSIVEEEDDEEDNEGLLIGKKSSPMDQVQRGMERVSVRNTRAPLDSASTANSARRKRQQVSHVPGGFFELNLDGATLLGRRKQNGGNPPIPSLS